MLIFALYILSGHDVSRDGHQIAGDVCMRVTLSLSIARGRSRGSINPSHRVPLSYYKIYNETNQTQSQAELLAHQEFQVLRKSV